MTADMNPVELYPGDRCTHCGERAEAVVQFDMDGDVVELLLCGQHFAAAGTSLAAMGARILVAPHTAAA